jgi:hypothetical protein
METEVRHGSFLLFLAFEIIQNNMLLYINAREV